MDIKLSLLPSLDSRLSELEGHEELCKVVDDLHGAEDGEAGEEPHGATDHPQLGLQGHLPVLLYLNIGGCVKVYLN